MVHHLTWSGSGKNPAQSSLFLHASKDIDGFQSCERQRTNLGDFFADEVSQLHPSCYAPVKHSGAGFPKSRRQEELSPNFK